MLTHVHQSTSLLWSSEKIQRSLVPQMFDPDFTIRRMLLNSKFKIIHKSMHCKPNGTTGGPDM